MSGSSEYTEQGLFEGLQVQEGQRSRHAYNVILHEAQWQPDVPLGWVHVIRAEEDNRCALLEKYLLQPAGGSEHSS